MSLLDLNNKYQNRVSVLFAVLAGVLLRFRTVVKLLLHVGIFLSAYLAAFLFRFEFAIPYEYQVLIWQTVLVVLLSKALAFLAFGLYQGWWRYVSIRDILPIAGGCTVGSLLFWGADKFLLPGISIPRSIYAIDWTLTLMLVLGARYCIRFGRETFGRPRGESDRRVLIVGAGSAGQMIVREIRENPSLGMIEVGFVDDDKAKLRTRIDGVPVLGDHEEIPELCEEHDIDEIVIAIPSAPPSRLRHILEHCRDVRAKARILPSVGDLIGGKATVRALRNVDLEDLLGRDPVELDVDLLHRHVTGHTVMVTV